MHARSPLKGQVHNSPLSTVVNGGESGVAVTSTLVAEVSAGVELVE